MKSLSERPLGYDVDDNATRFSNYFHGVLVEVSCNGWMPLVAEQGGKYALGDHVHDDARALTKIKRRLYELALQAITPAPSPELAAMLDRVAGAESAAGYLDAAYGEAKPALIAAMRIYLDHFDPVADEPSLRLLRQLVERQERHIRELRRLTGEVAEDRRALPCGCGPSARLRAPPLGEPLRRDSFATVTEAGDPFLTQDLYVNGREPRRGARRAAALPPRPDGRRAVGRRADGPQLARAPGDALGLPRTWPARTGTRCATPACTTC